MSQSKTVLLLTATINPSQFKTPFTTLIDTDVRFSQYYQTVSKYVESPGIDAVILCDNSLFPDRFEGVRDMAKKHGKKFEYISFLGNVDKIHSLGKGFGEGEILKYAIENSEVLKDSVCFYKVTGRIYISNIYRIVKYTKSDNCFLLASLRNRQRIDTRFFKVNIEYFREKLIDSYLMCDDFNEQFLEDVYFKILSPLKRGKFFNYPDYKGLSGSDGTSYEKGRLKLFVFNVANFLGFL